jgi:hypothetical protein
MYIYACSARRSGVFSSRACPDKKNQKKIDSLVNLLHKVTIFRTF